MQAAKRHSVETKLIRRLRVRTVLHQVFGQLESSNDDERAPLTSQRDKLEADGPDMRRCGGAPSKRRNAQYNSVDMLSAILSICSVQKRPTARSGAWSTDAA